MAQPTWKTPLLGLIANLPNSMKRKNLSKAIEQQKKKVEETAKQMRSAIVEKNERAGVNQVWER